MSIMILLSDLAELILLSDLAELNLLGQIFHQSG